MAQPINDNDWNSLNVNANFPRLVNARNQCRWTAPQTFNYNCYGWAIYGNPQIQYWINPPQHPNIVDQYMAWGGLIHCLADDNRKIVRAYVNGNVWTHADRWNPNLGQNGYWESKMGSTLRMAHPDTGLTNSDGAFPQESLYGTIARWYRPNGNQASGTISLLKVDEAAQDKVNSITSSLSASYPKAATTFDTLFNTWKSTWNSTKITCYQSSSARCQGPAWTALVTYGRNYQVLPQVVQKLTDSQNHFGVELYNTLQTDSSKKVSPSDISNYYVLSNQAAMIIKLFNGTIQEFEANAREWAAHQNTVRLSSSSSDYFNHESFNNLVSMGKPIVPLIMVRYANDQSGWWHELLYRIENGRESGQTVFNKPEVFETWRAAYDVGYEDIPES